MRYLSIDLETTGLDPEQHEVLELAAIIDDLKDLRPTDSLPRFQAYVVQPSYRGDPFALSMNAEILRKIAMFRAGKIKNTENNFTELFLDPSHLIFALRDWLRTHNFDITQKITVAGKNVAGFDLQFIKRLPEADTLLIHHRVIDPAMFYLREEDVVVPDTKECLVRADLMGEVQHRALDDALDVIRLIRTHYEPQYKE